MSDWLRASVLQAQAAGRPKSRLRRYRAEVAEAVALQRKGHSIRGLAIVEKADRLLMHALFERHGVARVMKHAHRVTAAMERVKREEAADLFA